MQQNMKHLRTFINAFKQINYKYFNSEYRKKPWSSLVCSENIFSKHVYITTQAFVQSIQIHTVFNQPKSIKKIHFLIFISNV